MNDQKLKLKISSSFGARARCKHCMGAPEYYFRVKNRTSWVSHRKTIDNLDWIKKVFKRMSTDYYLVDDPSKIISAETFSHAVNYKGVTIKLHKNKGVHPYMDYTDLLVCKCGKTTWAYYQGCVSSRPEILNRQSKYKYQNNLNVYFY